VVKQNLGMLFLTPELNAASIQKYQSIKRQLQTTRVSGKSERLKETISTPIFGNFFQTKSNPVKNKWWLPIIR
jgi:hypothetical protein